jgi:ABC-type uncharacterized transport system permease subunit
MGLFGAYTCPICRGPLGAWAIKQEFTCHHCRWALRANTGKAFAKSVAAGVATGAIALGLAAAILGWSTTLALLEGASFLAVLVGGFAYRKYIVLTPLRPQQTGH